MAKNDQIDLSLPGAIIEYGQAIAATHAGIRIAHRAAPADPQRLGDAEDRLLAMVKGNATARKMVGIRMARQGEPEARVRLRVFCLLAFRALGQPSSQPVSDISDVAAACMDTKLPPGEAILKARTVIGAMAVADLVVARGEDGGPCTRAALPGRALEWISGGRGSLGFLTVAKLVGAAYPDGIDDDAAPSPEAKAIPTARQLYDRIRERVIDLDRQAEVIASRLVLHMTRARMLRTGEDPGTPNECWIVIGPPGVGKTWICEVAGSCCGIPFATADASDLSAEGYVGMSVSDTLKHLVVAAKGNADEARYGFLALDEYTKKARSMGESPVNTVAVQQETLRIISGQAMLLGGRRGWDRPIQFSTVGTCFALMGHCPGLDRLVEKRMGRRMGFSVGNGALRSRAWLNDALLDFGLIEELVSRLTAVIVIPPPSLDTLMKALVAEHGIVGSYNRLLAGHGAMLFLTPPATQALAEHGMEGGYFRAMKRVVSALAGEVVFEGRKGTTMVEASDIRRAAAKAEDGAADLLAAPRRPAGGVPDDGQADEHSGAGFANG